MNTELSTAAFGNWLENFPTRRDSVRQLRTVRTVVSQVDRKWRPAVVEKLEELVALPVGWDGYNAPPVSFATAEFALRMLEAVCSSDCACPQVVPGDGGELQIEWHTPDGSIELHVRAPNDVHAWRTGFELPDTELNLTNDFIEIVRWLQLILRGDRASSTAAA